MRALRLASGTAPREVLPPAPCIVFPRIPVRIRHDGEMPFVADHTIAVVYRRRDRFERECLTAHGVASDWIELPEDFAEDALERVLRGVSHVVVQCPMSALLLERVMLDDTADGADPLWIEEGAMLLLSRLLTHAPLAMKGAHARIANEAKAIIARDPASAVSLASLAREFDVSPFHLCRLFLATMGTTLSGYRNQLRMRMALDELASGDSETLTVARNLGYADVRVFRRRFRRVTGLSVVDARNRTTTGKGRAIRAAVFGAA
jgi:AraC-like DNA-binding protein